MGQTLDFIREHAWFAAVMLMLNLIIARHIAVELRIRLHSHLYEAAGERAKEKSFYRKCLDAVARSVKEYEKQKSKKGFYRNAKDKMKRSGYRGEYAAVVYILLKYIAPVLVFVFSFAACCPRATEPLCASILVYTVVEVAVASRKKKHNLVFEKHAYKIYKYLHNQISSGVMVTDAVRSVYEVIENRNLKDIMIQLAAMYELTLNMELSLEEFKSNFDAKEAETLCVALKQGIMTGDNRDLLARQEEVMFKKYFNYIQAETDGCRAWCTISVAMFTAVIVIMISVPLFNDVTYAVSKIFGY